MQWYFRFLPVQGLIFNIAFALLAFALNRWLIPGIIERYEPGTRNALFGVLVALLLIAEPFALRVKFRETLQDVYGGPLSDRDAAAGQSSNRMILAWLCHLVLAAALVLVALQGFDLGPRRDTLVFVAAATLIVLREMYILYLIIVPPERKRETPGWHIALADAAILALAGSAHVAAWHVLIGRTVAATLAGDPVRLFLEATVVTLVYLAMLFPLRIGFLVTDQIAARRTWYRIAHPLTLGVAAAAAVIPLFVA
jgi:hypothetical protein